MNCGKNARNMTRKAEQRATKTACAAYDEVNTQLATWEDESPDEAEELASLETLLEALSGCGCSHEWNGERYPNTLIADYHFSDYAQELAEEIGAVSRESSWIVIDWEATANGLKNDYKEVDFDGSAYWYRA
jgi:hypothetical protein